jgi:hypothetical protein
MTFDQRAMHELRDPIRTCRYECAHRTSRIRIFCEPHWAHLSPELCRELFLATHDLLRLEQGKPTVATKTEVRSRFATARDAALEVIKAAIQKETRIFKKAARA